MKTVLFSVLSLVAILAVPINVYGKDSTLIESEKPVSKNLIAQNRQFRLINNSDQEVCVAKAKYYRGHSSPDFVYPHYYAEGWKCVAPFTAKTLYRGGGNIRLHIDKGGAEVLPNNSFGKTWSMCVFPERFKTKVFKDTSKGVYVSLFRPGASYEYGSKSSKSCGTGKGKYVKFHLMRLHTEFTVN